jgi:hypothetical protein
VVLALSYYIFFDQSFSASKRQCKTVAYQRFVRQMYHACLALIFEPLKAGMTTLEVVRCPNGHFRHAVYCTISTKCSGDGDTPFFLMCLKFAIIQKKIYRPPQSTKI